MATSQFCQIPIPVYLTSSSIPVSVTVGIPDLTAFTYGTTAELPVGGVYQDTSPTVTAGHTGAFRITQNRALHSNLRNSAGTELIGQQTMSVSLPVALASDQTAIPVNLQDGVGNVLKSTVNALWTQIQGPYGQAVMTSSIPVVIASNQSAVPISGSVTVSGTVGALQSGTWDITNITGVVSLPTGASTETTLAALSGKLPATLGQKAMSASLAVALASDQSAIPVTQSGTWTVQPGNTANTTAWLSTLSKSATSTLSNVASSATSVTLLASNANRLGAMFFNDSTQILYLKFGTTASNSSYTVQLASNAYYEIPGPYIHTGRIDGIWASANGNCRVTEITA